MLISITGNIASGKSRLTRIIKEHHPSYRVASIDRYRHRCNPEGTEQGENRAWEMMIRNIRKGGNIIMEQTGVGQHYEKCLAAYPGKVYTIMVICPTDQCLRNHNERMSQGYEMPPLWFSRDISEGIEHINLMMDLISPDLRIDWNEEEDVILELISLIASPS
jgi:hypothetical protein